MFVDDFVKGLQGNPFCESLLRNKAHSMVKIKNTVTIHIKAKEFVLGKRAEKCLHQAKIKDYTIL